MLKGNTKNENLRQAKIARAKARWKRYVHRHNMERQKKRRYLTFLPPVEHDEPIVVVPKKVAQITIYSMIKNFILNFFHYGRKAICCRLGVSKRAKG